MAKLKVASLFCGCGGTDVGMMGGFDYQGRRYDPLPLELVYANDIEQSARQMFQENFGLAPDGRDILKIPAYQVPECDILTGGFPCQSFSIVAQNPKRLGVRDEKGQLFFDMCRILRAKKPLCFVAENVKGLLSANNRQIFPLILREFEQSGYRVTYRLLNAADFGVPQKRERVILVGFREDLERQFVFPTPPLQGPAQWVPLGTVLEPSVPEKYYFSQRAVEGMLRRRESMNKGRAQDLARPCNTVGAHLAKVSLNSTDPVLFVEGRYRRFTPREVARIQSFPESYRLVGSESAQYRALGNAMAPVMLWHVGRAIVQQLRSMEIRPKL